MHRSRAATLLAAALVVAGLATTLALPAAAHVNHVSADPQVSADGTVVAETAFVAADGYLVVHRDDDGAIGEPIGHRPISAAGGLQTDVAVTVEAAAWRNWSTGPAWLVLHTSDGDGSFEPSEDDVLTTFGRPAGQRITLGTGDRALVTAEAFAPQRVNVTDGRLRLRTAHLPTDGAVVVRNASDGRVLGRASLAAGAHANVTVALNESFLADHPRVAVRAVLTDGDGREIRAGDAPVATTFGVRVRQGDGTPTGAIVRTASATPGGGDDATDTPSDGSGPGAGVLAALGALGALACSGLLARRGT